jgi:hypothetical protein
MSVGAVLHLLYLLVYFVVAGQAVFYLFCFSEVFKKIPADHFVGIRKLADPILEVRLKIIYYSSLLLGLMLILASVRTGIGAKFLFIMISYLLLLVDVALATRFNIPLNKKIRDLELPVEANSSQLQMMWIKWITLRGRFVLAGFVLLLVTVVL